MPGLTPTPPGDLTFPQQVIVLPGSSPAGLRSGKLILDNGCLRIRSGEPAMSVLIIWPIGVTPSGVKGEIWILNSAGQLLVKTGEEVALDGGELDPTLIASLLGPRQKLPDQCPGPYWVVTGSMDVISDTQAYTGITAVDTAIQTLLSGDQEKIRTLVHFTEIACKTAQSVGGPPQCAEGEAEGTLVPVIPIVAQEGFYFRPTDMDKFWLNFTGLYAVYRVGDSAKLAASVGCPAGDYGLLLLEPEESIVNSSTIFVTNGKIVCFVANFSETPAEALERAQGEVIYKSN